MADKLNQTPEQVPAENEQADHKEAEQLVEKIRHHFKGPVFGGRLWSKMDLDWFWCQYFFG